MSKFNSEPGNALNISLSPVTNSGDIPHSSWFHVKLILGKVELTTNPNELSRMQGVKTGFDEILRQDTSIPLSGLWCDRATAKFTHTRPINPWKTVHRMTITASPLNETIAMVSHVWERLSSTKYTINIQSPESCMSLIFAPIRSFFQCPAPLHEASIRSRLKRLVTLPGSHIRSDMLFIQLRMWWNACKSFYTSMEL